MNKNIFVVTIIGCFVLCACSSDLSSGKNSRNLIPEPDAAEHKEWLAFEKACTFVNTGGLKFEFRTSANEQDENSDTLAVFFHHLHDLILKHDGKNADSLPDFLKQDNRQTIYRTIDQYGMFNEVLVPELGIKKIGLVQPKLGEKQIEFSGNGKKYTVDLKQFWQRDGILFFCAGKVPFFWDAKAAKDCDLKKILECYFFR